MIIKICGITHLKDAQLAVSLGADYIGLIFAEESKRRVFVQEAQKIVDYVKESGKKAVGVFVEQGVDEINYICGYTGIQTIQLHGGNAQKNLSHVVNTYEVIDVNFVNGKKSEVERHCHANVSWLLYDLDKRASSKVFDWKTFHPPLGKKWFLAGGLNHKNVEAAIRMLQPNGVDVASGVEYEGSIRKNPYLLEQFIQAVRLSS